MANGNSDIQLLPGQVKVAAWDLCIDSDDRRQAGNNTPFRRALVHDYGDGLTVNWGKDYPNGVVIKGVKTIEGHGVEPNLSTGFSHSVAFKARIDCYAKMRFVAGGWSTDVYTDPSNNNNLIVENKPFLGQPPRHVIFKTPVRFDQPHDVMIDGHLKLKKQVVAGAVAPPGWNPYYDVNDELQKLRTRVEALEKKVLGPA